MAICAPTPKTLPRCCGRPSRRAASPLRLKSRVTSPTTPRCAPIRVRRSSAAPAASSFARHRRSRRPAIMWRSTPMSAGAAAYALPPEDVLMRKLRAMLIAYREAGGEQAVLLVHDEPHGAPLIHVLARFGDGLPAQVLPFSVNEITQVGLESIAAAFAYGASAMRFLLRAQPRHDVSGLRQTIGLAEPILSGLGFRGG